MLETHKEKEKGARGKPLALPVISALRKIATSAPCREAAKSLRRIELVTSLRGGARQTVMGSGAPGPRKPFIIQIFDDFLARMSTALKMPETLT